MSDVRPPETVEELLDFLNVTHITSGHHHTTSGWIQTDCDQCSPDSGKYRLGFHSVQGNASCWACGPRRSVEALSRLSGVPAGTVHKLLKAVRGNGGLPGELLHTGRYTVPFPVGKLLPIHRKYLRSRKYDPQEVERLWQVQGVGRDGGRWKWRLFIPVTMFGKPVSWVTRSVRDGGLRYLSAEAEQEAVPHKHTLYGLDYVRHSCVVVEGPTGCWRVGPGCVATFGTRFDQRQVSLLAQVPRRYVMFDPEPHAQAQARKLCDLLSAFPGTTELVELDEGVDPGTLSPKQVRQIRSLIR